MPRCPKCGGTVAQVILPASATRLVPVATIACCGAVSCGWVLGAWAPVPVIEQLADTVGTEVAAL